MIPLTGAKIGSKLRTQNQMYENKMISIVVPAFNEELLLPLTLKTMPAYVDQIVVINDCSTDLTADVIKRFAKTDKRIKVIEHQTNMGLGQSLIDGYLCAIDSEMDVISVMAGDNQMSPNDLPAVIGPVARGEVDYVKGNRLLRSEVIGRMPRHRYFGNAILTLLTKFATGYWRVIDPQCGYTAISREALTTIPIEKMVKGYGYNAHILYMLNLNNRTVTDVEVEPIYGDEKSKIKLKSYIPTVSKLLLKLFVGRLFHKFLVRDFHPLVFLYAFSAFNGLLLSIPLLIRIVYIYFSYGFVAQTSLIIFSFVSSTAFFSLIFAMWMDMEENQRLFLSAR